MYHDSCIMLQEYYLFGLNDLLFEYLLKYKAKKGVNLVTEIFDIWNESGCIKSIKIYEIDYNRVNFLEVSKQIDPTSYLYFIDNIENCDYSDEIHAAFSNDLIELIDAEGYLSLEDIELPQNISELMEEDNNQLLKFNEFYHNSKRLRLAILYAKKFKRTLLLLLIRVYTYLYSALDSKEILTNLFIYGLSEAVADPELLDIYSLSILIPCINLLDLAGLYNQELRCLEYILKSEKSPQIFNDLDLFIGLIKKYINCCISLELYDKASAMIDLQLANSNIPQENKHEFTDMRTWDYSKDYTVIYANKH